MKQTQLDNMKKALEVLNVFAPRTNANAKKVVRLQSAIEKIEAWDEKGIVDAALKDVRPAFDVLPREVKGIAKKQFCNAVYDAIDNRGVLYFIDVNGNCKLSACISAIRARDNEDLFKVLRNYMLQDAAKDVENAFVLSAFEDVLNDEINQYSVPELLKRIA